MLNAKQHTTAYSLAQGTKLCTTGKAVVILSGIAISFSI